MSHVISFLEIVLGIENARKNRLHHRSWIGTEEMREKNREHAPIEDQAIQNYSDTARERNNSTSF